MITIKLPVFAATAPLGAAPPISPLIVSDRLIALARDAEAAGCGGVASHLLRLACDVLDQPPRLPH